MVNLPHHSFVINERSEANLLKNILRAQAEKVALSDYQVGKLDIIIAELTSNFLKHAHSHGEVLFRTIQSDDRPGIEVIGIDHGPGMLDPAHRMQDGVSTTQTMGTGMGAIRRLSDDFDLYSLPGWGTLTLVRIFKNASQPPKTSSALQYSALLVAHPDETQCGDGWAYKQSGDTHCFMITDGLGHGPHAHEASQRAIIRFEQTASVDPLALMRSLHEQLSATRGAVGLVVSLDVKLQTIDYCGVGNISFRRVTDQQTKRGVSAPGILGKHLRSQFVTQSDRWPDRGVLFMHSDGLDRTWNLDDYPNLLQHDRSLWGAALYKDHRQKDDFALITILLP